MDIAIPSPQAVLIISFNIFRVLCRRYGIYLIFGLVILIFQGFSGYYILYSGIDDNIGADDGPRSDNFYPRSTDNAKVMFDKESQSSNNVLLKKKLSDNDSNSKFENQINLNADTHNKGPPNSVNAVHYGDFGFTLPCEITNKEVVSALQRAKTLECRKKIANISCEVQKGTFYPSRLVSFCPTYGHIRGRPMGCFRDNMNDRILGGHMVILKKNSPSICSDICFQRGFVYSGVQYVKECFCGNGELSSKYRVPETECDMKCAGTQNKNLGCGGYLRMNIIETGLSKTNPKPLRKPTNTSLPTVRIAYILTVNGRSLRQIFRLFKTLFHQDHFFFIHVDLRQHYLYRELLHLEETFPNVILSRKRFSSIWGGSSLLKVLLHCMKELLLKKEWNWDFVINLSESDFPIKTNRALVEFLTANKDRNFLKSHGHDTNKFLQKQGLDRTFLECETHMWRIGERKLPLGIRIDGGSDWICLNRQFVDYITRSDDVLVDGLKKVFSYTLLPGESFFHTVLRNSEYCQTFTDNNLHVTNWKRKLGCRCQYKHIVDWCGCSPNDFTINDWAKLEASRNRNLFFGRKFEAVKSLGAINMVDEWLYGRYDPSTFNLRSFWDNIFHFEDPPSGKDDAGQTLFHSTMRLSTALLKTTLGSVSGKEPLKESQVCDIISVLPTQAHSHHITDQFQGLLVEFMARTKSGIGLKFETLIQQKNFLQKISDTNLSRRLTNMEVNTNFDLKEQIFRNFGGHLGPQSEVWVAVWLTSGGEKGSEREVKKEDGEILVEVVLVDSLDAIAAQAQLKIEEGEEVVTHTFSLNEPLRPGMWKAFLVHEEQVLISLQFPILPVQFIQGRQLSVAEGRKIHSGPKKPYSDVDGNVGGVFKNVNHLSHMPTAYPGNKTLLKAADEKALLFGPQLSKWIDQVVNESYYIQGVCYVSTNILPPCLRGAVPSCSDTPWSSHSSDPKSQLGRIDPKTGRLVEPFRSMEGS